MEVITEKQSEQIEAFVEQNYEETLELLRQLSRIPAPTHREEKKAAFVKEWLEAQGAEGVYIDQAKNVVFPYGCEEGRDIIAFLAHTDVVFPDMEPFEVKEEGDKMYAPGVLDDNANLACLMMGVKYVLEHGDRFPAGILFVANACEEGLGNLKGSRQILEDYGDRIREFISFDGEYDHIVNRAVGSQRYRISVKTEGGHSYNAFGNANAIYELSRILQSLYQMKVSERAKSTFNVGTIEGGTSVNTIAESASMLFEFRSEDSGCLAEMEAYFESVIESYQTEGIDVNVEILGIRPCGKGIDEEAQQNLTDRHREIIRRYTDREIKVSPGSTDANTFLAHGIPSNVIGAALGEGTHTREEWLYKSSLIPGQKICLASILQYGNLPVRENS